MRHPSRIVSYNRFLEPQILGGPFRAGVRRGKWTEHVLALAMTIFNDHFFEGVGAHRDIQNKTLEVAADRGWWFRVVGVVRCRWRRLREGHEIGRAHGRLKKNPVLSDYHAPRQAK